MKHMSVPVALLGITACTAPDVVSMTADYDLGSTGVASSSESGSGPGSSEADATATDSTGGIDPGESSGSTGEEGIVCGDGVVEGDEVCDDGINDAQYGGCAADCSALAPHCGDGKTQDSENCDDGNKDNGDGCNVDCVASGSVLWSRQLSGNVYHDLALDDEDGVLAVANTSAKVQYYDRDGVPGWSIDVAEDRAVAVAWHPTEGWAVTGTTVSSDNKDVWFRRYDSVGAQLASFSYETSDRDEVSDIAFDSVGDIYAVGRGGEDADGVAWLRKYTNTGAELWSLTVDGPVDESDLAAGVVVSADDEVIVAGHSRVSGNGDDIWVKSYDPEKNQLWGAEYSSPDHDRAFGLGLHPAGGVVVAGAVDSIDAMWAGRFDVGGLGVTSGDVAEPGVISAGLSAAVDSTGAIVLIGIVLDGEMRAGIRKFDAEGVLLWSTNDAPEGGGAGGFSVVIDSQDAIIVAGGWQEPGVAMDGWVRKYAP